MGNHKLVVFSEHRSEDEAYADKNGSRNKQNARAIRVEDLTHDRREEELAGRFVILCPRRVVRNEEQYIPSGRVGLTRSS